MATTVEAFLTDRRAFGLTTASPVQRAICRIADGLPLGALAQDENVLAALGGAAAVERLPRCPPKELYVIAAIRCGKSKISAALASKIALEIDLARIPGLGVGETARVSVVSIDKDKAGAVMGFLREAFEPPDSALHRFLCKNPKPNGERIVLRRADGRRVEIVVAAGRRAGGSLVSRWTVAAIFDEAARMLGDEDGVVNFDDSRKGVIARLGLVHGRVAVPGRPGGQLIVVTSPWAARGPVYEAVEEHWGKPSEHIVVVRATGPQMNPVLWTPEACEAERQRPNSAYETDVLGLFSNPESGWLSAVELNKAKRQEPMHLPPERGVEYTAAIDPATKGNAWTVVVVGKWPGDGDEPDRYKIAFCRQWQGTPAEPLKARAVFDEMAPDLARYGVSEVHTDRYADSLVSEIGEEAGITVTVAEDPSAEIAQRYLEFRTLLLDGRIEVAPDPVLCADLLSVKKKLTPGGGVKFDPPVTGDGRHGDYAPAAVLAVAKAGSSPGWVSAMRSYAQNRPGGPPAGPWMR